MFTSTDIFSILGQRGSGKSFLCKKLQEIYPRIIVFDSLMEYTDGLIANSFQKFCELILKTSNEKQFKIIYRFSLENSEKNIDEFNQALRILYYRSSVCIIVEEVQNFSSAHMMPHWMKQCLLTGRHRKLSMIFTTQRPAEMHKTIISQSTHLFCGQIHEKNDVVYLSNVLNNHAHMLKNLAKREFLYWTHGQTPQKILNDFSARKIDSDDFTEKVPVLETSSQSGSC